MKFLGRKPFYSQNSIFRVGVTCGNSEQTVQKETVKEFYYVASFNIKPAFFIKSCIDIDWNLCDGIVYEKQILCLVSLEKRFERG